MKKKILAVVLSASMALSAGVVSNISINAEAAAADSLVYSNNFENGLGDGCKIVGSGKLETTTDSHGTVFHNAVGGQAMRANYLLLPSDVLEKAVKDKSELTISLDVNVGTATDYFYTPLFSAYADQNVPNTWPMMIIQSRGLLQVNCNGWTDFKPEENVKGENAESTVYLDDKAWHNVTVTYTKSGAVYYVDGEVVNEWKVTGADGSSLDGLLSAEGASQLKYICVAGNQAWDWKDVDAAYLVDNIAVYSSALSGDDVKGIVAANLAAETPSTETPDTTTGGAVDATPETPDTTTPETPDTTTPETPAEDTTTPETPAEDTTTPETPAEPEDTTTAPAEDEEPAEEETVKAAAKLNKKKATVKVGKSVKLKVQNTTKKVTWSSSNKKVAKVSKSGKVTGVKAGKAVIKAKVGGKTLKCNVTVK